ncbi:MAG TPA: AMP-binding protein [Candidatus Binatia bacterium]|nr:AMP-binding protein [Candidatus Binatia bacterium]
MEPFTFGGDIVWWPSESLVAQSRLKHFMDRHAIATAAELHEKSIANPEWFWNSVLEALQIEFYEPYSAVVDLSQGIEWPRWCVNGKMNVVHNCLDKWIGTATESRVAIRWEGEEGATRVITYGELYREVNRFVNGLRQLGLKKGEVVGIFMPMVPEIAVATFALAKIGALILPLFSGFGAAAVAARLMDAQATGLITADGFYRRGGAVDLASVASEALLGASSIKRTIVLPRLGTATVRSGAGRLSWEEVIAGQSEKSATERTEADDSLMIIYTSGTSGKPKGALHTHCGFPIKAAQDMMHGLDVSANDTLYWVTDMGWMMGPWELFGATLHGATMLFYDGALDHPDPSRLWRLVEEHGVTILGVSPTLVRVLMRHGDESVEQHDLSKLRILASTGEPWNPEPWRWLFEKVGKKRLPIINYSGGTEIAGGILMGNVLTPLKPCAFSGPLPGMAADVVDDNGRPVRNQVGELIIRQPWIGMTRGFWHDPQRYLQTYWSRFPKIWLHGDWAAIDEDGLWYVLGRSDDTIKVGGKRVGPAEIESILVEHPSVSEAAAIAVPDPLRGEAVICFCVLISGEHGDEALAEALKEKVARSLGKPLKPEAIKFVGDLPKTRNAKIMRRVIRAGYLGQEMGDLSALENPLAVDEIRRAS